MTLIRRPAYPFQADVLRGDRSPLAGDIIEVGEACELCATPEEHERIMARYREQGLTDDT